MPEFNIDLISHFYTAAAAFGGSWLAMRQYRSNKWWDQKNDAYHKIITALTICSSLAERQVRMNVDSIDSFTDVATPEQYEKFYESQRLLHDFCSTGNFLISRRSSKALKKWELALLVEKMAYPPLPYDGWYDLWKIHQNTLETLTQLAKQDLHTLELVKAVITWPFRYLGKNIDSSRKTF